jgi:hypothetical protein
MRRLSEGDRLVAMEKLLMHGLTWVCSPAEEEMEIPDEAALD